jgi:anaerobic magnesium-protoporphyrin IX monomethyl ester cyclase
VAKLVLVNHWPPGVGNNKPPLGLGYLASYLKKVLDFHDMAVVNTGDRTLEKILEHRPEMVGFTVYTAGFVDVMKIVRGLKKRTRVPVLAGGPHVTCLPGMLPREVDVGCVGEGEQTLLELVELVLRTGGLAPRDLEKIPGLVFWDGDERRTTPARPHIRPLDRIPYPDREILNIREFLKPSQILMNNEFLRGTTMLTSRGCPFRCAYCHVSSVWGTPRYHSPGYVVDEMDLLVREYGVEAISIGDDLFAGNTRRIGEIIDGMERRGILGRVRFQLDLRASMVNDGLIRMLKRMGVVKIDLGLESGSDRVLRTLKGKDVSAEINLEAVKTINRHGIGTYCCFMLGSPGETREDVEKTRDLIRKVLDSSPKNFCQVSVTTPLPGTPLWDEAVRRGLDPERMDWRQYSLNPLESDQKDFYLGDRIPYREFRRLLKETVTLGNSRRLESILSNFSWRYVKRIVQDPRLAWTILRDYARNRGFFRGMREKIRRPNVETPDPPEIR